MTLKLDRGRRLDGRLNLLRRAAFYLAILQGGQTLAVHHGMVPPTINLDNLDPVCAALGLNYTPNTAVAKRVDYALANSFGFGGTNASLVVGRI